MTQAILETSNGTPEASQPSTSRLMAMGRLGQLLPYGTLDPATGKLNKTIATRKWNLAVEKKLGRLREQHRDANVARHATMVLAVVCSQLGSLALNNEDQKSINDAIFRIGQLTIADVLYAYVLLRRDYVSPFVNFEFKCTSCGFKGFVKGDLNDLDVRVVDLPKDALWEYVFLEPFSIRAQTTEKVVCGPARWSAIDGHEGYASVLNTGATKASTIWSSIHQVVGREETFALTENDLDEMGKTDIEHLAAEIDMRALGPRMMIELKCGACFVTDTRPINWVYDSFFAISSH